MIVSNRESKVHRKFSALPMISNESTEESGMMTGLTFRLWGATGVMTKLSEFGNIIGPPQLKEYAVEPVGVEIITPSPQKTFKNSLLM